MDEELISFEGGAAEEDAGGWAFGGVDGVGGRSQQHVYFLWRHIAYFLVLLVDALVLFV